MGLFIIFLILSGGFLALILNNAKFVNRIFDNDTILALILVYIVFTIFVLDKSGV